MADKICTYCGNPKVSITKQGDNLGNIIDIIYCAICTKTVRKKYGPKRISREEFKRLPEEIVAKGKEWVDYAKEYVVEGAESYLWQIFLWRKDKDGKISPDISDVNIQKCQRLYDDDPNDVDNLVRLLILKLFADKDYKNLANEFILIWKKRNFRLDSFFFVSYSLSDTEEPYISKFRNFLLWLIKVNTKQFKEEALEEWSFPYFSKVLGVAELSWIIDPEEELYKNFDFRWDDEYLKYYALGKYYYSEERWLDAFCIFTKLQLDNLATKVSDEELLQFKNDIRFYEDVLYSPPTLKDIKQSAYESFSRIDFSDAKQRDRLSNMIRWFYVRLWKYYNEIEDKEKELNNYLKVYNLLVNVLSQVAKKNYAAAFDKWVEWDKSGYKLMGLDIWEMTQGFKNLKEGTVNEEGILKGILSNTFIKDFDAISQMELKLRDFVVENLKEFYQDEENAWCEGVPREIRIKCSARKEEASDPKSSKWVFFDFPDYSDIICERNNWNNIFKEYFIVEPKDANKGKDELTAPLRKMPEIRNIVVHTRRPLEEKERADVNAVSDLVNKIYEKWKSKKGH